MSFRIILDFWERLVYSRPKPSPKQWQILMVYHVGNTSVLRWSLNGHSFVFFAKIV